MSDTGNLKQRISEDIKQSLRSGDAARKGVLRMLMASITNTEKAQQLTLDDGGVIGVISKEVKTRRESLTSFREGNRPDLAAIEETALVILAEYQPQQIGHEEIVAAARRIIAEAGAAGPGDKGKVMPKIMAELKGKADGREINEVVTGLLSA